MKAEEAPKSGGEIFRRSRRLVKGSVSNRCATIHSNDCSFAARPQRLSTLPVPSRPAAILLPPCRLRTHTFPFVARLLSSNRRSTRSPFLFGSRLYHISFERFFDHRPKLHAYIIQAARVIKPREEKPGYQFNRLPSRFEKSLHINSTGGEYRFEYWNIRFPRRRGR